MGRWTLVLLVAGASIAAAAAVAVVGIALGGGGSSGSSPEEYQVRVVNTRDRVEFALARMAKSQSVDELTARLDEAAEVVDDTAGDLDGVGAADGFEDENDKLVRALHALSDELAGTAGTLRDPAFTDVLPVISSLSFKQWEVVNRLLGELKRQGIEVEPLARH